MNALLRVPESQPRHKWTWDEVLKMAEVGLFERADGWRVELIDGELIDVAPQTLPHRRLKRWLTRALIESLPGDLWHVMPDAPMLPQGDSGPEPDLYVYSATVPDEALTGADVALVIEISVTSLDLDLQRKRALYAALGVQEYWVFDVLGREVVVHRDLRGGDYASAERRDSSQMLTASALPEMRIDLSGAPW